MDLEQHERWNEEMARKYNPDSFITKSGPIVRWVEKIRLQKTVDALAATETDSILDLGCGAGNLLPLLKAQRIVGLDPSDLLLAQARERVAGKPSIQLLKGFAEKLPFGNAAFDGIVCSEVLEHVRHPEVVLQEMNRVAKPGAKIVITVPNEDLINLTKKWVLKLGLKKWVAGDYPMSDNMLEEWHVAEVTEERLKILAKDCFKLDSIISVPFPVIAFHRIFIFTKV
jgi:ubiquinone/menaquinone biosynthesis C-methylase UbiE